ncbi:MAG: DUF2905 domain-containing protein [Bacillota bacterium]
MEPVQSFGKLLLVAGAFLFLVGAVVLLIGKIPGAGRLPGDIYYQRGNFSFYFPVVTCILLSIILTIILNLFVRR